MAREIVQQLMQLAAAQHGVIATHQGRAIATPHELRRVFAGPHWHREARCVFGVAGAPRTRLYCTMVAVLRAGPGAVISHDTALWLWDVIHSEPPLVHLTRMRAANGSELRGHGIVPHQTRRMPGSHVTVHRSFPIVTPARALIDVAAYTPMGRVERWLDRAWMLRLVDHPTLSAVLVDLDKRGRRGIKPMKILLDQRGPDFVPPESGLESRLNSLLSKAGLPNVRRQVEIGGERWLGRVDFRLGDSPIIVEVQSDLYHTSLSGAADDARRFGALSAAGFSVVPVWESAVWSEPKRVVGELEAAMRELRR